MAWITKDSAGATFPRRDEPYLTDAMKQEATEVYLPRYETNHAALIPVLHMIQHAYHWIPPQALEEVAAFLELTPADVLDTASFYEEFWLKPRGTHCIAVCRSMACEFCGHKELTDAVREKLDLEPGETTDDGKFTLVELECLGACGEAPVALVDEELKKYCTPGELVKAIDELQGE